VGETEGEGVVGRERHLGGEGYLESSVLKLQGGGREQKNRSWPCLMTRRGPGTVRGRAGANT